MAFALYVVLALLALDAASRALLRIPWRDRLILLVLPLLEAGEALLRGRVLGPIDLAWTREPLASVRAALGVELRSPVIFYDQWCQIIPWRQAVRSAIAAGEWPLWNPFVLAGEPLLGVSSPAVFHPIHLASLLLPLPTAVTFVAAATLGCAALSMYLLARDLDARGSVGLFAAAAWAYGAFHLFWLGWPVALAASAVPLLVLAARRVACRPGAASAAVMAVAWMLLFLGGSPEVALPAGLLAGLLFLGQLTSSPNRRSALWTAAAGTTLGLLLSGVQLVPFLDALPQTAELAARKAGDGAGLVAADSATSTALLTEHLLPFALGTDPPGQRVRRALEPARATSWIGSVGLVAAIYGFAAARTRWRWALAGALLCGVALATFLPAAIAVAQAIPGLSLLRPRYGVVWSSFSLALLAGIGLEAALRAPRRRGVLLACCVGTVALGGALAIAAPHLAGRGVTPRETLVLGLTALLPVAVFSFAIAVRARATVLVALALGGLLVERQIEMGDYYQSFPVEQFYPAVDPLGELETRRGEGRFVALGRAVLHPNTATMWKLEDVRGYDPMALGRLVETYPVWAPDSPRQISRVAALHPFLSFMNVRFALASAPVALLPGWKILRQGPGWVLYENEALLPPIFSPTNIRLGGSTSERLRDLAERSDYRDLAWIETADADSSGPASAVAANGPCEVSLARRGQGWRIEADCRADAWLATSTPAWRGWRATEQGTALVTGIVNHAFVAIQVPAGRHEIDFEYRPRSAIVGGGFSLSGLALVAAWVGLGGVVRRRSRL
jgi:hypothetical protein